MTTTSSDLAVVWGNCQAEPLADLLRAPLASVGITVVDVPPVYLAGPADLAALREQLPRCRVFVTQPVSEAAYGGGRGNDTLERLLPDAATVVRVPITYDTSAYPFQVHGHGADGVRVNAAVTDYHDLRAVAAAHRGMSVNDALAWWPQPPVDAVRELAEASQAELRRRERDLDVHTSDLLDGPDAMWTMSHPTNRVLAEAARRILAHLGPAPPGPVPVREYLGARRAPLDTAVADAHGWPATAVRPDWTIDGRDVGRAELLTEQLAAYATRPDVVADIVSRHGVRMARLGTERNPM